MINKVRRTNSQLWVLCLGIATILIGCSATVQPVIKVPVGNAVTIGFERVMINIPPGKSIGASRGAVTHIPIKHYYWDSSISVGESQFNQMALEELKNAGYQVAGENISVFGSQHAGKARLLLGGTISDITFNTYVHETELGWVVAGNSSKATLSVKWEVMDKNLNRVVYEKTTNGEATFKGINAAVVYGAFRDSIRKLLADQEFPTLFVRTQGSTPDEAKNLYDPISIKSAFSSEKIKSSDLIKRAIQAVVTIKTSYSHGSGFIISEDGYVITNFHTVSARQFVDVLLANNITLQAEVIRINQDLDLALLKLNGSGFSALPLGDSDGANLGEEVFGIGTPAMEELGQSVSKGIISGIRKIEDKNYIQTDVKVNPGNSGGPLINSKGEVLGVITMKLVGRGIEGLAFCIPIKVVIRTFKIIN